MNHQRWLLFLFDEYIYIIQSLFRPFVIPHQTPLFQTLICRIFAYSRNRRTSGKCSRRRWEACDLLRLLVFFLHIEQNDIGKQNRTRILYYLVSWGFLLFLYQNNKIILAYLSTYAFLGTENKVNLLMMIPKKGTGRDLCHTTPPCDRHCGWKRSRKTIRIWGRRNEMWPFWWVHGN
jgi:hypothetical protein